MNPGGAGVGLEAHAMRTYLLPLSALLVLTLAAPAQAVDGVLEINQTKALAGGVTPSDTPGFPVTLDQAGSYRLTGNLLVTAGTAILIGADDVTLDLNGFTVSCARAAAICPNTTAPGVDASGQSNVAIFNGTVRAMGGFGIRTGDDARIKMLRVVDNQNTGITVGNRSSVHNCNVSNNGAPTVGSGILVVGSDAVIADNTVSGNANLGIGSDFATTVIGNNASTNAGGGIAVGPGSTVVNNTATKNGTGGILAQTGSTLKGNAASQNGMFGISAGRGSTVSNNTAIENGISGISALGGSTVIGNTVRNNTSFGFQFSFVETDFVGYALNVATQNNGGSEVQIGGFGVELGLNFCGSDTVCP